MFAFSSRGLSGKLRKCPSPFAYDALAFVMLYAIPSDARDDGVQCRPKKSVVFDQDHEEAMKRVTEIAKSAGLLGALLLPWAVILAWLYSHAP